MLYNVGMYIRLSREDKKIGESNSVASQREIIKNYCANKKNFNIYDEYIDDGFTGTDFNRESFRRLISDIENKSINCVVVKDLSRLGRNQIETDNYVMRYFPQKGIRFISVNDALDLENSEYNMIVPIKNMFNEHYSRDISKKVQSAMRVRAEQGLFIGSHSCYGYKKSPQNKNKLIVDDYAASVVKKIYNLFLQGHGKLSIAKKLNEQEILCPTEYKIASGLNYTNPKKLDTTCYWTSSSINAVLRQEMYTGTMVQGKRNSSKFSYDNKISKENWIRVQNTHEAIIDKDTFNKVQNLLELNTRQADFNENISIFAGLIKCGNCSRALIKSKETTKYNCKKYHYTSYRCRTYKQYGKEYCTSHRIGHNTLVDVILSDINSFIYKLNNIDKVIKQVFEDENRVSENEQRIKGIKEEISRIKGKKIRTYNDYNDEIITREEYLEYKKNIDKIEDELNKKLLCFDIKPEKVLHTLLSNPLVDKLYNKEELTEDELTREVITEIVKSIVVYENKETKEKIIEITYNFSNEMEILG